MFSSAESWYLSSFAAGPVRCSVHPRLCNPEFLDRDDVCKNVGHPGAATHGLDSHRSSSRSCEAGSEEHFFSNPATLYLRSSQRRPAEHGVLAASSWCGHSRLFDSICGG